MQIWPMVALWRFATAYGAEPKNWTVSLGSFAGEQHDGITHFDLFGNVVVFLAHDRSDARRIRTFLLPSFVLSRVFSTSDDPPGNNARAELTAHWHDIPLHVAQADRVVALIKDKRRPPLLLSDRVPLSNHPGRCVRDGRVENLFGPKHRSEKANKEIKKKKRIEGRGKRQQNVGFDRQGSGTNLASHHQSVHRLQHFFRLSTVVVKVPKNRLIESNVAS